MLTKVKFNAQKHKPIDSWEKHQFRTYLTREVYWHPCYKIVDTIMQALQNGKAWFLQDS